MNDALLRLLLIGIAGITVLSGAVQIAMPETVLGVIATSSDAMSAQLFRTVGMFMVVTGGLFWQSLIARSGERLIPFWIGVQKFAAAVLVTLGWNAGLFAVLAMTIAVFDLATGVLCFVFWRRLAQ